MRGKVGDTILKNATGHKTLAMLDLYANHIKPEEITMLKIAQKEVFEPFFGKNS